MIGFWSAEDSKSKAISTVKACHATKNGIVNRAEELKWISQDSCSKWPIEPCSMSFFHATAEQEASREVFWTIEISKFL